MTKEKKVDINIEKQESGKMDIKCQIQKWILTNKWLWNIIQFIKASDARYFTFSIICAKYNFGFLKMLKSRVFPDSSHAVTFFPKCWIIS